MSGNARSLSTRKQGMGEIFWFVVFGVVFTAAGAIILWFLLLAPVLRWRAAQGWVETSCQVLESSVRTHSGDDGTTYSVRIRYTYDWEGRQYTSERYDFMIGSSSGQASKQAVVSRYPAGRPVNCYVNPDNPAEAVLSREFSRGYFIGLFGLPFLLIGLAVLFGSASKTRGTVAGAGQAALPREEDRRGSVQLKPAQGPVTRLIISLVAALGWNAVVGVMAYVLREDWNHDPNYLLAVFVVVFGAVGVGLAFSTVYYLLALANPRPVVHLTPGAPRLGETVLIEWSFHGNVHRLQQFRIVLEGQEEATYRRGTKTHTARQTFEKLLILETPHALDMRTGRAQFEVPEYTMHTLDAPNNKVNWSLKFEGTIARWPDLAEDYPVQILPIARSAE